MAILAINRHFCHFRQIRHFCHNRHFQNGPFAISFEFLFTIFRFWQLIAVSSIFAKNAIFAHFSGKEGGGEGHGLDLSGKFLGANFSETSISFGYFKNYFRVIHYCKLSAFWSEVKNIQQSWKSAVYQYLFPLKPFKLILLWI